MIAPTPYIQAMQSDDIMANNLRQLIRSSNFVYVSVPSKDDVHNVEVTKKSAIEMVAHYEKDEFTGFSASLCAYDGGKILYIDRSI
jgi:hypothetical protein